METDPTPVPDDDSRPTARAADSFRHDPVMVDEVVAAFAGTPAGLLLDATAGGGGHSEAILDAHPHLTVLALDQDPDAVAAARRRLARHGDRVVVERRRFDALADAVEAAGARELAGFLFDLGVSSHQLDTAGRGFSYRADGPLDMRMDPDAGRTADILVNELDESELARLLERHGDERHARRIAAAIVAARPVRSTAELADIVRSAIPAAARRHGGHPAKRSFQALRIEVNDELAVFERALLDAVRLLAPGGRGVVLAYHSGEDRIAKHVLREVAEPVDTGPRLPVDTRPAPEYPLPWRGARRPGADEVERNPRAESARMRIVERVDRKAA